MIAIGVFDIFLYPTVESEKTVCVTLGADHNSEFYRVANLFENVKNDEKTCFTTTNLIFMIGIGFLAIFLYPTVEPDKIVCVTLGSDKISEFYGSANFFENVKNDEKTSFSTKNLKFMLGIGLFDIFLYPTVEPCKIVCVTLGSDKNSEFYRSSNFFESVKNDEKTCFSTKNLKFMIGIGLFDIFLYPTEQPEKPSA